MDINNVNSSYAAYASKTTESYKTDGKNTEYNKTTEEAAVVYEKSGKTDAKKATYQLDNAALINQMKADLANRKEQLRDMVAKMLGQQGNAYATSLSDSDMYKALRTGNFKADPETIAQAKKDVAEDGYWGVEQTSERIVSFAKALVGGDASKAESMLEAFKKGYDEATKAWGDKLPDISKRTYDAVLEKFSKWTNGVE